MELDVHIIREADSAWGFTLVGGNDSEIPLTVIKVLPDSPADRAGLQNGDTILRIDDIQATDMTHAAASKAVSAADDNLVLGVVRGLYDPVLDDFEPLYEPIDQEDSDQNSEPTEVPFKVAEFIEVPPPLDSRSLTSSPFVQQTKPYRPFSTEPLDIPPLEDPIILNPNYKDNFPQHEVEDILQVKPDIPPERKFKLPIADQYDPEGKKIKKILQESSYEKTVVFKEEKESREEKKESKRIQQEMKEKELKQDVQYMEIMKKEIDLEKIEMTASEIVEESIQKATSVAQEVKNEIDIGIISQEKVHKSEIKETKEVSKEEKVKSESRQEMQEEIKIEVKEDSKVVSDLVQLIDKTTDKIIKQSETKDIKKEVEKFESKSKKQDAIVEERKSSTKQEIEETIESGTVRAKSAMLAGKAEEKEDIERKLSNENFKTNKQELHTEVQYHKESKSATGKQTNDTKTSTAKLLAEQRAYTIGMQTIPNIRGSTHSSHHYNLLLKTFFIHLTDVMVALSRFILTEPVFSEDTKKTVQEKVAVSESIKKEKAKDLSQYDDAEQRKVTKEVEMIYETKIADKKEVETKGNKMEKEIIKDQKDISKTHKVEEKIEKIEEKKIGQDKIIDRVEDIDSIQSKSQRFQQAKNTILITDVKDEMSQQERQWREEKELINESYDEDIEYYEDEEFLETRRKRGAEMAQMSERKSAELMEKLDAVITEFQAKAGIEESDKNVTVQRRTRSRSRSKAQERAMRVSEPLEMSSKVEQQSHEITEMKKMSSSQSYEAKKMERRHETRELKTPTPQTQDGKIMYVAIVESHVYTNPNAIIEETTTESAETTMTTESMEASRIDRVAMESSVIKQEIAETVIHKAQEIEQKKVEVIQPIQIVEDIKSVQTRQATSVVEMSVTDIAQSSEVSIEEVKDEVLKVQEPPAQTLEVIYEASAKSVAESSEAYVEEVKTETLEIVQPKALQAKEIVETVAKVVAEASEVSIEEVKHEEFEVEEATVTQAEEIMVENKATAVAEATSVPIKLGKTYDEASAELKIVKFVPTEVEEPVVVISEVELALQKRDIADSKIYESIVGVQTAVQENRDYLDVSQQATFKSIGETKLDKTINIEEVEEVPIQVIEKTEVAIEGLNETDTEMFQAALIQHSVDQKCQAKAITLSTEIEKSSTQETHVEQVTEVKKASFEAKSVVESTFEAKSEVEASFEAKSEIEASFEAKSVSKSFESKSVSDVSFEAKSVSEQKLTEIEQISLESSQKLSQQKIHEEVTEKDIGSVKEKEVLTQKSVSNDQDSSSPPIPATPITDEYMFKLEIPLPKNRCTTPVPRDCTPPDDEDPHIVKKKLIPKIDTTIESYTYEPPLPTPPAGRELGSPEYKKPGLQGGSNRLKNMRYIKPGLRGGSDRPELTKEEIMEIERKSSLLASAIDKTLKSIEEYKEEVGIEAKKEMSVSSKTVSSSRVEHKTVSSKIQSNGATIKESKDSYEKEWKEIENQVQNNHKNINELSINVTIEEANGNTHNGKENKDDKVQIIEVEVNTRHNGNSRNGFDTTNERETKNENTNIVSQNMNRTTIELPAKSLEKEAIESIETSIVNREIESKIPEKVQNGHETETLEDVSIPQTQNNVPVKEVRIEEPKEDPMHLYKPVKFDPEEIARRKQMASVPVIQEPIQDHSKPVYMTDTGEIIGTYQGIVDGLEEAVVDIEVAKALGKPGMPDEKIAELISGEAEMLREAHVMGLARVLSSHMHRADDDSSVDFQKIKPVIESLKDSEVLKALNEEVLLAKEKKKKEEKKWTTFLQKPKRPVPRPKFGYYRYVQEEQAEEEPYKVKIVKQPKPKVAPDYKPEDFDTGPLPWEQSQPELLPGAPPVEPEEPILIPEEVPEFLEAVDPLPESEVPDLEDTGIPLPPPPAEPLQTPSPLPEETDNTEEIPEELDADAVVEESEQIVEEMEGEMLAQQLLQSVQKMVDPNATLEQQLAQMRAQIAALAQLPCVIQQTLDLVTRQITQLSHQDSRHMQSNQERQYQQTENQENEYSEDICLPLPAARKPNAFHIIITEDQQESGQEQLPTITEPEDEQDNISSEQNERENVEERMPMLSEEELARRRKQEEEMMEEQQKIEKQRKDVIDQMKLEHESRQVKQRPTPRVGKPKPMFGSPTPVNRPVVLPGGRRWRRPQDVYNEQMIAEVLNAQSEIIQGKVKGTTFESVLLPYDERINFMKYEKPPVSLDHLQRSEVYKVVHNLDETPLKRVETRTPVIAEADYRERCRSISPYPTEKHVSIPQQLQP